MAQCANVHMNTSALLTSSSFVAFTLTSSELITLLDKRKLPPWRYALRQKLLPLVRWETPYLALLQDKMRTPALDSYFAITANLGTHTAFMIILPILFWCGFTSFGHGYGHTPNTMMLVCG